MRASAEASGGTLQAAEMLILFLTGFSRNLLDLFLLLVLVGPTVAFTTPIGCIGASEIGGSGFVSCFSLSSSEEIGVEFTDANTQVNHSPHVVISGDSNVVCYGGAHNSSGVIGNTYQTFCVNPQNPTKRIDVSKTKAVSATIDDGKLRLSRDGSKICHLIAYSGGSVSNGRGFMECSNLRNNTVWMPDGLTNFVLKTKTRHVDFVITPDGDTMAGLFKETGATTQSGTVLASQRVGEATKVVRSDLLYPVDDATTASIAMTEDGEFICYISSQGDDANVLLDGIWGAFCQRRSTGELFNLTSGVEAYSLKMFLSKSKPNATCPSCYRICFGHNERINVQVFGYVRVTFRCAMLNPDNVTAVYAETEEILDTELFGGDKYPDLERYSMDAEADTYCVAREQFYFCSSQASTFNNHLSSYIEGRNDIPQLDDDDDSFEWFKRDIVVSASGKHVCCGAISLTAFYLWCGDPLNDLTLGRISKPRLEADHGTTAASVKVMISGDSQYACGAFVANLTGVAVLCMRLPAPFGSSISVAYEAWEVQLPLISGRFFDHTYITLAMPGTPLEAGDVPVDWSSPVSGTTTTTKVAGAPGAGPGGGEGNTGETLTPSSTQQSSEDNQLYIFIAIGGGVCCFILLIAAGVVVFYVKQQRRSERSSRISTRGSRRIERGSRRGRSESLASRRGARSGSSARRYSRDNSFQRLGRARSRQALRNPLSNPPTHTAIGGSGSGASSPAFV